MAFRIPTFGLNVNLWRAGTGATNPPDLVFTGNLSPGKRSMMVSTLVTGAGAGFAPTSALFDYQLFMELLCPRVTDIRAGDPGNAAFPDLVECPAGSGRYYLVVWVDDVAKGFSNEYRIALIVHYTKTLAATVAWANVYGAPNYWPLPTP